MLNPVVDELEHAGPFAPVCAINGGGIVAARSQRHRDADIGSRGHWTMLRGVWRAAAARPCHRAGQRADVDYRGIWSRSSAIVYWCGCSAHVRMRSEKTIKMEGVELTVIGVMPSGFGGLQADVGIDLYVPNYTITPMRPERPAGSPQLIARLKSGVSRASAQAETHRALAGAHAESGAADAWRSGARCLYRQEPRVAELSSGLNFYRDRYARSIRLILGLTVVLMLLAALNLGGLLLTRLTARSAELGVRLALGSSGGRLAQQMLLEGTLLSAIGAFLGVPLAFVFVRLLVSYIPNPLVDNSLDFSIDARVLMVTTAFALVSAAVMTALPIGVTWRQRRNLLAITDRTVLSHTGRWARVILVVQVAMSMVMLTGAGRCLVPCRRGTA